MPLNRVVKRRVVVFGSMGQIGSRVLAAALRRGRECEGVEWRDVPNWFTRTRALAADYIVAFGLTDPKLSAEDHLQANLHFPRTLAAHLAGSDFRLMTMGSILELLPTVCRTNTYLASKLALAECMSACKTVHPERFLHTRLHTIYSHDIKPHMFLGQVFQSLITETPFAMTTGEQLREYHHADDIAHSMMNVIDLDWGARFPAHLEFNSCNPISLGALARHLFAAFGKEHLLQLGALGKAPDDNWQRRFERSPATFFVDREPFEGVTRVLKEKGVGSDRSPLAQ